MQLRDLADLAGVDQYALDDFHHGVCILALVETTKSSAESERDDDLEGVLLEAGLLQNYT